MTTSSCSTLPSLALLLDDWDSLLFDALSLMPRLLIASDSVMTLPSDFSGIASDLRRLSVGMTTHTGLESVELGALRESLPVTMFPLYLYCGRDERGNRLAVRTHNMRYVER